MFFYDPSTRESIELTKGIHGRTFWGNKLLLAVVDLEENSILPNHSHPHEQGGIVIKGELELTIAGEAKTLVPGDIYIIPGGIEHSARVRSQPAQVVDIFTPVREDLQY